MRYPPVPPDNGVIYPPREWEWMEGGCIRQPHWSLWLGYDIRLEIYLPGPRADYQMRDAYTIKLVAHYTNLTATFSPAKGGLATAQRVAFALLRQTLGELLVAAAAAEEATLPPEEPPVPPNLLLPVRLVCAEPDCDTPGALPWKHPIWGLMHVCEDHAYAYVEEEQPT